LVEKWLQKYKKMIEISGLSKLGKNRERKIN
jgi:hypothetical protein